MNLLKKNLRYALANYLFLSLTFFTNFASASQVLTQWYHGTWDCQIDGRPSRMEWLVVDDPRTVCDGEICSSTSAVKTVGRFSDSGSAWVELGINYTSGLRLGIRYLGHEQDNWELTYNRMTRSARGHTTWRGNRYPLSCRKLSR